ncbi:hypothetical protein RFI_09566, partial [Reticulomyxa filosa]
MSPSTNQCKATEREDMNVNENDTRQSEDRKRTKGEITRTADNSTDNGKAMTRHDTMLLRPIAVDTTILSQQQQQQQQYCRDNPLD